jgi:hypothetical protein
MASDNRLVCNRQLFWEKFATKVQQWWCLQQRAAMMMAKRWSGMM